LGAAKLVCENTERFGGFLPDWQGKLRLAFRSEPANGGEQSYLLRDGRWEPWRFVPFEDSLGSAPIYFNRTGTHLSAVSRHQNFSPTQDLHVLILYRPKN
jgi:hypothetical protein